MAWVKHILAAAIFAMAAWYATIAWNAISGKGKGEDATSATWRETFDAAAASGRPVLVDIWAHWCKNCIAMENETMKNPDVAAELRRFSVVRLRIDDFSELHGIRELGGIGIRGIPAFIVFEERGNEHGK